MNSSDIKESNRKINIIFVTSPIMESLTGIMIAIIILYQQTDNKGELEEVIFIFSCNDVGLSTSEIISYFEHCNSTRTCRARKVLPIIDENNQIIDSKNAKQLNIIKGEIKFENVEFNYSSNES